VTAVVSLAGARFRAPGPPPSGKRLIGAGQRRHPTEDEAQILREVAEHNRLLVSEITGRRRSMRICVARRQAFFRLRDELDLSYPKIAQLFGMDHTAVLSGVRVFLRESGLVGYVL
jgi:chromosomal replication initiation ATPase DnaA